MFTCQNDSKWGGREVDGVHEYLEERDKMTPQIFAWKIRQNECHLMRGNSGEDQVCGWRLVQHSASTHEQCLHYAKQDKVPGPMVFTFKWWKLKTTPYRYHICLTTKISYSEKRKLPYNFKKSNKEYLCNYFNSYNTHFKKTCKLESIPINTGFECFLEVFWKNHKRGNLIQI